MAKLISVIFVIVFRGGMLLSNVVVDVVSVVVVDVVSIVVVVVIDVVRKARKGTPIFVPLI